MRLTALLSGVVGFAYFGDVSAQANNDNVLVKVGGFAASTPDDVIGNSWAYESIFKDAGFKTIDTNVGKFSSNWDRACELYAQLKGTRVDYGVCHSTKYGHLRFGKDFTGIPLYPEWDANHKIHLIGHSMAAQTMRVMENLLREGSGCAQDTSDLFKGGRDYISSITTLSGVHDGTTFLEIMGEDFMNFARDLIVGLAGILDSPLLDPLFEIDLTAWGLERAEGESFLSFWNRAQASGILSTTNKDFSLYELSEAGARSLNNMMKQSYPNTYYFSFATERTKPDRDCFLFWCGDYFETPESGMSLVLRFSGSLIGKKSVSEKQKNDGIVPWNNQLCPTSDSYGKANCSPFTGTWTPGKWHYVDVSYLDHTQITKKDTWTDFFSYNESPKKLYQDHAKRLKALPVNRDRTVLSSAVAETIDIQYLSEPIESESVGPKNASAIVVGMLLGVVAAIGLLTVIVLKGVNSLFKTEKTKDDAVVDLEKNKRASVSHYLSEEEATPPAEL